MMALLRVLPSVGDDGRGCDLRTLADLVHHIHVVRIAGRRLGGGMEACVQVSQRQVTRHDLVAIFSDQVLRIRLAGAEVQAMRRKLCLRQGAIALDLQILHHVERAFGDLEGDVHVSILASNTGNDLRLAVSRCAIGVPQILHAAAHQGLAVLAVREQMSLLDADVRLQLLAAEVVVPFECDLVDLVAAVFVDVVHDGHAALVFRGLYVNRGVEIALGLEIGNEIALPFLDELIINGVHLVHGDQIAHRAFPYVRAHRGSP